MGCRQAVEIREVPELTAPATAGWWHPVIMLPDDWRSWNDADRRAVLAHELAHIHRWDYAAGLSRGLRWRSSSITRWSTGWPGGFSCNKSWRRTRWAPGSRGAGLVSAHTVAAGTKAGRTVSELAGEGVPPGTRNPDQEDRHVAE